MTRLTVTAPADEGAAGDGDPQTRQERAGIIGPGRVLTSRISLRLSGPDCDHGDQIAVVAAEP